MRITVAAIGRLKAGPERELLARFLDRFAKAGPSLGLGLAGLVEQAESRAGPVAERRQDEAGRLLAVLPAGAALVVLDEAGAALSSAAFAADLARRRDAGLRDLAFLIGGPDGVDPGLAAGASGLLSLGAMTWPHQIARILLAEQLYRAATILAGHPYHRA